MVIGRGDVFWCDLGEALDSAPAKRRPVLVVQADSYTRSELSTVVVLAITSKTALAEYPGNVFVPATASGLTRDSVVNVTQVTTVDKGSLGERVGELPPYLMRDVDAGLNRVVGV